jgi:hypothetical protein
MYVEGNPTQSIINVSYDQTLVCGNRLHYENLRIKILGAFQQSLRRFNCHPPQRLEMYKNGMQCPGRTGMKCNGGWLVF